MSMAAPELARNAEPLWCWPAMLDAGLNHPDIGTNGSRIPFGPQEFTLNA